jgi:hypothetical protein
MVEKITSPPAANTAVTTTTAAATTAVTTSTAAAGGNSTQNAIVIAGPSDPSIKLENLSAKLESDITQIVEVHFFMYLLHVSLFLMNENRIISMET